MKHKKKNVFAFKNFAERISEIKINVYHHIQRSHVTLDSDKDAFFRECLEKWAELNCTIDFTVMYRELRPKVQSFNQLVYHKDQVVAILKKFLTKNGCLCIDACLDLVIHLAKDLQVDFYPLFESFFQIMITFVKGQDTDLIEKTFTALAYLFKFLWRYMLKEVDQLFRFYKVLLSDGQKIHTQAFASESFAYLLRKAKHERREKMLKLLVQEVSQEEGLAHGVGLLLFHSIKGVTKRFNSHAVGIIKSLLALLQESSNMNSLLDYKKILEVLKSTWSHAMKYTTPEYSAVLFLPIYEVVRDDTSSETFVDSVLELLLVCVEYKSGSLIPDHQALHKLLSEVITHQSKACSSVVIIRNLLIALLQTDNCESASCLTEAVDAFFKAGYYQLEEKLSLARTTFNVASFPSMVKPFMLRFVAMSLCKPSITCYSRKMISQFLAEFVALQRWDMSTPANVTINAKEIINLVNYSGDSVDVDASCYGKSILQDLTLDSAKTDPEFLWSNLVVLPFIQPVHVQDAKLAVAAIAKELLTAVTVHSSNQDLFILSQALKTSIMLSAEEPCVPMDLLLPLLRNRYQNVHVLQAVDAALSRWPGVLGGASCFADVYAVLKENLCSSVKLARLLTIRILKSLSQNIGENSTLVGDVLHKCMVAEAMETTFHTFKEQLLHLRRLARSSAKVEAISFDIGLRLLVGNLYVNFSPIWDPIIDIIQSYAEADGNLFWETWRVIIDQASSHKAIAVPCSSEEQSYFQKCMNAAASSQQESRVDHVNFRLLLWKAMTLFPDLVEQKSRDVVPLFLKFIDTEFRPSDESIANFQDLRKSVDRELPDGSAHAVESNEQLKTEDRTSSKLHRGLKLKILCSFLKLFSLFKNPKALSKEPVIYKLYLEFLTNRENDVQKLALDCLMTYKFPYLKPYSENFERLMNDTTFRDELVLFSSEEGDELIKKEHKSELMEIVIRLLYGKLQRKSGLGAAGKTNQSARRNVIMQFLSNCSVDEIRSFLSLVLEPLSGLRDLRSAPTIDFSRVISLRKQDGFLHMCQHVVSRLNHLIKPFLSEIYGTILRIVWFSAKCLSLRSQIQTVFISRLKSLRQLSLKRLGEFFDAFGDFSYEDSIDELFDAAVWPQASLLPVESSQNVTPLVGLLVVWSRHNRYHPLLNRANVHGDVPLKFLVDVLEQGKTTVSVQKTVLQIIENLLNAADFQPDSGLGSSLTVLSHLSADTSIGTQIVTPHVPGLLKFFSKTLHQKLDAIKIKKKRKIGSFLPPLFLSVLSKISSFVTDAAYAVDCVGMLLPLLQSVGSEESQIFILTTVRNLLKYVEDVNTILPWVPPLFMQLAARKSRVLLCDTFEYLVKDLDHLTPVSEIVTALNSWDRKQIEEADYDRRLEAYRTAAVLLHDAQWSSDQIRPVLYNSIFFLSSSADMSLQDASSSLIEKIIAAVQERKDELYDSVVEVILLPSIQEGIRSKVEGCRLGFISLMALLVKAFDKPCYMDLKCLLSSDPEMDFFENIRHIQVHRKIRAVHLLSELCEAGKLSVHNLYTFLLPMISHFVFDSLAAKDHNLLSETVAAIGAIVKCFGWSKYNRVLASYLKLLAKAGNKQKTIIRVVTSILNSFHFDLSGLDSESVSAPTAAGFVGSASASDARGIATDAREIPTDARGIGIDARGDAVADQKGKSGDDPTKMEDGSGKADAPARIHRAVVSKVLPHLLKCLTKRLAPAVIHKLSQAKEDDEEQILRVPVALAIVKLLQKLPKATLHLHLPGLLIKVCHSLKSHARNVRDMARDTLVKIAVSLGPAYFSLVVREAKGILVRGYQLHILGYTLHSLLDGMKPFLSSGDLDASLESVMAIFTDELYGNVAEEKAVEGITSKLHEAKSKKTNDSLELIAKFISSSCILDMVRPLREMLEKTTSYKIAHKIEEALRRISLGLQNNSGLSDKDLLIFVHGVISNTLPRLVHADDKKQKHLQHGGQAEESDIFIVPAAPSRSGKLPDVSRQTNEYIMLEFALQLLQASLKRQRFSINNEEHLSMLDPLVPLLSKCLLSKFNKVITLALRCSSFLIHFPLPSYESEVPHLAKTLFKLLKKYARAGGGKGENYELVYACFKAMTVILRDFKLFAFTQNQLQILLAFVEEDVHDYAKQATSFPLLKAILARKLEVPAIHDVMKKIADLSIRDGNEACRAQCRQMMMQYLLDYPLGKKLQGHIDFFVMQLTYAEETGRTSALEFLAAMFHTFPQKIVLPLSGYFFIPLGMIMVNDDSSLCKKMAAATLKELLRKLGKRQRDELFEMVKTWAAHEKRLLRSLAAQLVGIFAEIETAGFEERFAHVASVFLDALVQANSDDTDDDDDGDEAAVDGADVRQKDQLVFCTLTSLARVLSHCDILRNEKYGDAMSALWEAIQNMLLHPHVWIRVGAAQLFGILFARYTPEELAVTPKTSAHVYLTKDPLLKVKELMSLFFDQLEDENLREELARQATKNLVFLMKVTCRVDPYLNVAIDDTEDAKSNAEGKKPVVTIRSMLLRMSQLAARESSQNPKQVLKRTCVFGWIASLCVELGKERLSGCLVDMIRPLHREIVSSQSQDSELQNLASEVLEVIRSTVDKDTFSVAYAKLQKKVRDSRESRKRKLAEEAVSDVAKAAQRKQKQNLAKREQRKRKLYTKKPNLMFKKLRSSAAAD